MPQLIVSSASGTGVLPVAIVKLHTRAGSAAMASWHRNVQQPFIDTAAPTQMLRADVGWNWPRNFWAIVSVIWTYGHKNFSFALVARNASGSPVTVALALGMEPYSCVEFSDGRRPTDGFVWYITGIPADAAAHYGVSGVKVTAQAVALCKKICQAVNPDAEIALHADPRGPALLQFYAKKCMMNPIPVDAVIRAPRKRINDGRFFYSGTI